MPKQQPHTICPHPELSRGKCYYILPTQLLQLVIKSFDRATIDPQLLKMDQAMSKAADATTHLVGFFNGAPIYHDVLRFKAKTKSSDCSIDEATLRWLGWDKTMTTTSVNQSLAIGDQRIERIQRARQAYCGWLTCNPEFLREQDTIWDSVETDVLRFGIPAMGSVLGQPGRVKGTRVATGPRREFLDKWEQFLKHWELKQLPGPRLPLPDGEIWANLGRSFQPGHRDVSNSRISLSKTAPLPPTAELTQMLEDAADRHSAGDHLVKWMKIVRKDNSGKQTLGRYARLFRLQHYWRVLEERYPEACQGRKDALTRDFSLFLEVNYETLRDDLKHIRRLTRPQ